MKSSALFALIALLLALVGILAGLMIYFKKRKCAICDDFSDMMFDEDDFDFDDDFIEGDACYEEELPVAPETTVADDSDEL